MVSPVSPDWSYAALSNLEGKSLLHRTGSVISDSSRLLAIYPTSVVIQPGDGNPCKILMFEDAEAQRVQPVPTATPKRPERKTVANDRSAGLSDADMQAGIKKISDTKYNLKRSLVDKLLTNQAGLMRIARVIPHQENGKTIGVQLHGVEPKALLGRLGLQNDDLMRAINGFDMSNPASAPGSLYNLEKLRQILGGSIPKRKKHEYRVQYTMKPQFLIRSEKSCVTLKRYLTCLMIALLFLTHTPVSHAQTDSDKKSQITRSKQSPSRPAFSRPRFNDKPLNSSTNSEEANTTQDKEDPKPPEFESGVDFKPVPPRTLVTFNLEDANLPDLVRLISNMTGRRFILPDKVRAIKATVFAPTKVTVC